MALELFSRPVAYLITFFNLIENFLVHSSSTYLTWFVMAEGFHMKYFHSGFFDNQLHFFKMGQTSNFIDSLDYKQLKWQVTIKLTLLHLDLLTSSLGHSHSRGESTVNSICTTYAICAKNVNAMQFLLLASKNQRLRFLR